MWGARGIELRHLNKKLRTQFKNILPVSMRIKGKFCMIGIKFKGKIMVHYSKQLCWLSYGSDALII